MLYVTNLHEALLARRCLREPVEVAFGKHSVLGEYKLDHHGSMEGSEAVSVVAAKIALQPDFIPQRFYAVTGLPDPDAIYAILVLSGQIKPDMAIARAIGELDVEPVGICRLDYEYLRIAAFDLLFADVPNKYSEAGFAAALVCGREAFSPEPLNPRLEAMVRQRERERFQRLSTSIVKNQGSAIAYVESDEPGRDVWHCTADIVVQYKPGCNKLTLSALSATAAARIQAVRAGANAVQTYFGEKGLLTVYPRYDHITNDIGGGRSDIGGWGREGIITKEMAETIYSELCAELSQNTATPRPNLTSLAPDGFDTIH